MKLARQLLLALWAGILVGVGGLVAPTLFALLEDRQLAGRVAAELFRRTTWLSVAIAVGVVALGAAGEPLSRRVRVAPLLPAALLTVNQLVVHPLLEAARGAGAPGPGFMVWHAVATVVYAAATLLVVAVLVAELRRGPRDGR